MTDLLVYRDDGPLTRALGRLAPRGARLAPAVPLALGAAGLLAAVAVTGAGASHGLAAAAIGWLLLTGGLSRGLSHAGRLRWAVPGLLRVGEYAAIVWIGALAGGGASAAAFALLFVVAFHQYDLVYRLRLRGAAPPAWLSAVTLGWDGRLVLAWILLAAGALPAGLYAAAAALAIILVTETVAGWTRFARAGGPVPYDEEDEAA